MIVKIQNRRGQYVDFDPSKLLPGEFAIVQTGDPNTADGKAIYIGVTAGNVKQLATLDELQSEVETALQSAIPEVVEEATQEAKAAANRAEAAAQTLEIDTTLTETGQAAEAKATGDAIDELNERLDELAEEVEEKSGLSETAKQALIDCFRKTTWIDYNDGQECLEALEAALYPETGLVSISAVFDSGQNIIYSDAVLDDLKAYLTVTALYNNGTSKRIRSYMLSGTLIVGQNTITVLFEGKTTTFVVTAVDALDKIAYGNVSYRELFETNNVISIGDFENITLSDTEQVLPNGDSYKINYGSPVISQDAFVSGNNSLKVTKDSMSSQVKYTSNRIPRSGTLLLALCEKITSYTSGNVGMQFNINTSLSPDPVTVSRNCVLTRVTSGEDFETVVYVFSYDVSKYIESSVDIVADIFVGEFTSGRANAYEDLCVVTQIPDTMTLSEASELYTNYVNIKKNSR